MDLSLRLFPLFVYLQLSLRPPILRCWTVTLLTPLHLSPPPHVFQSRHAKPVSTVRAAVEYREVAAAAETSVSPLLAAAVRASLETDTNGHEGSTVLLDIAHCFRTEMVRVWTAHLREKEAGAGAGAGGAGAGAGVGSAGAVVTAAATTTTTSPAAVIDPLAYRIPSPATSGGVFSPLGVLVCFGGARLMGVAGSRTALTRDPVSASGDDDHTEGHVSGVVSGEAGGGDSGAQTSIDGGVGIEEVAGDSNSNVTEAIVGDDAAATPPAAATAIAASGAGGTTSDDNYATTPPHDDRGLRLPLAKTYAELLLWRREHIEDLDEEHGSRIDDPGTADVAGGGGGGSGSGVVIDTSLTFYYHTDHRRNIWLAQNYHLGASYSSSSCCCCYSHVNTY